MEPHPNNSIELEATLAICAANTSEIAQQIAKIAGVAKYQIVPGKTKSFLDTYWDTAEGELASGNWALRLRESQGDRWIALKGPAINQESGGVRRIELEFPWSLGALEKIRQEMSIQGPLIVSPKGIGEEPDPEEALLRSGFMIIQRRRVARRIRNVMSEGGARIVEMALDAVEYLIKDQWVLHQEVEIEAKGPGGAEAIRAVKEHLLQEYGGSLRSWDYGKLATGLALEELLEEDASEVLVAPDGQLTSTAYDELEARLR
jgi:inorganic triphosphatase YgiF